MPSAARTVTINRPLPDVFAFFADAENDPKWRPAVKSIKRNGPLGVGARYEQKVRGPGGRAIPADFEVTGYEPDARVAFKVVAGPVRPEGEYRFVEAGEFTDVTFTLTTTLTGFKKLIMTKAVQKSMNAEVASLDAARRLLEQTA
jgi:uncharacterized membrane protein